MNMTNSTNRSLIESLEQLQVHDHASLIYSNPEEKIAVVVPFIRIGLERGDRCLYIAPESDSEIFMEVLAGSGINTADFLARGALVITTYKEFYRSDESYDPARFLGLVEEAITDAKNAGFTTLRLSDEKSCFWEGPYDKKQLIEFETRMNGLILSYDLTALCLYNLTSFSAEMLREIIRCYPKIIFGGIMCRNYIYLPPDKYFQPNRPGIEVENLLQGMLANEIMLDTLQVQKSLLKAVFENTPDIVYVKDLEGRFLMINPVGAAFFGKPIEEVLGRMASELLSSEDAAQLIEADCKAIASDQPISTELTFMDAGVTRTLFAIKGTYRDGKGNVVGVYGISRNVTEQKRAQREILSNHEQLRFLASQLSMVEEQERRRIASALHDQVGQSLALANIKLGTLKGMERGDSLWKEINKIRELLDDAIQHTRSLTMKISPPCLYDLGLEAAVHSLCEDFQREHGIKISLEYDGTIKPLHDDLRALLFHGIRELLVNIIKHARTNSADVSVERDGDCIRITVEDKGIGFDCSEKYIRSAKDSGFGLFSLRERLEYFGGRFDMVSVPGQGTRVTLVAPLIGEQKENSE
jgi:PAS domain S-box-containing protein